MEKEEEWKEVPKIQNNKTQEAEPVVSVSTSSQLSLQLDRGSDSEPNGNVLPTSWEAWASDGGLCFRLWSPPHCRCSPCPWAGVKSGLPSPLTAAAAGLGAPSMRWTPSLWWERAPQTSSSPDSQDNWILELLQGEAHFQLSCSKKTPYAQGTTPNTIT